MFTKNLFIFIIIFSITLWLGGSFALSVLAEETDLEAVLGCTDETAENYNPAATQDDGSCTYPEPEAVLGCTDQEAENYNPEATQDDGSCTYPEPEPVLGCTDSTALNYNPEATQDDGSCTYPESAPEPTPTPEPEATPAPTSEPEEPRFDPATAPSKVTIRVLMPDGTPSPFPVFVTFVGVGNKNFGGKINANGELSVTMPQGRYYTELMVISTEYIQGEDGPSFFLEANEERDLGAIRLLPKSEQDKRGQSLEDKTLEDNILAEVGEAKGLGKILVLIVKLLMKS